MKLISAFFSGLVLAPPVLQIKTIYQHKGKVAASMGFGAAAFAFLMVSIVLATMELVLQYEAQGFVLWSVMFTLSVVFFAFALISVFAAKAIFPKPEVVAPQLQEVVHNVLQAMANQFPVQNNEVPNTPANREKEREREEVAEERERLRQHPRGDMNFDRLGSPAFTH